MPARDASSSFLDLFRGGNLRSLIGGLALLGASFIAEHFANAYALSYLLRPTSHYVGDLLLDNLPVVNLNIIIVEGALIAIVVGALYLTIYRPRYILFAIKALALLIATRAIFISLTHVGIYPGAVAPEATGLFDSIYRYFHFQTGLFFSGHTSTPFLAALIFWDRMPERTVFLALSVIFGASVLLAHVHYSIDVFAAPFMAYGVFSIARHLFPRDYALTRASA